MKNKNKEKILAKGNVIYNFSKEKSIKYKLGFKIIQIETCSLNAKGKFTNTITEAKGVLNIAGKSCLNKKQMDKIMKEINKIKIKKGEKADIKITFEGDSGMKKEYWCDDPEVYGYRFNENGNFQKISNSKKDKVKKGFFQKISKHHRR
jgi:hypothetical protein